MIPILVSIALLESSRGGFTALEQALSVSQTKSVNLALFKEKGLIRPSLALYGALLSDDGKFAFSRGLRPPIRLDFKTAQGSLVELARELHEVPVQLPLPVLGLSPLPSGIERHGKVPGPGGVEILDCYGSPDGWRIWLDFLGGPETVWDPNVHPHSRPGRLTAIAEIDFRELKPQRQALSSFLVSTGFATDMPYPLVRDQGSDRLVVMWDHGRRQQIGLVDSKGKMTRSPHQVSGIERDLVVGFDSRTGMLYQQGRGEMKISSLNLATGTWHTLVALKPPSTGRTPALMLTGNRFLVNWPAGGSLVLIEGSGATKRFPDLRVYGASASGKVVLVGGQKITDPAEVVFLK